MLLPEGNISDAAQRLRAADPQGPLAADAYALLEEQILMSYEGSDWEEIPGEDAKLLAELRGLIDGP